MMVSKLKSVKQDENVAADIKVQSFYFDYPTKEFSLNDLCSILKISKTTANSVVQQLIKEGFLKREITGKLWRISCNQQHPYNTTRKVSYHLSLIYESGIIEYVHDTIPNARSIILFGSYRKGDDTQESDIDIAVEVLSDEDIKIKEIGKITIGYRKEVPVNLHIFSRNKVDLNLFANIANGIALEGFLEVRP